MKMDTQQLVQECNSGCKMAIHSMDQVIEYVGDPKLKKLIEKYKYSHENLEEESSELLKQIGKEEKEPGIVAAAFSWLSTETKLVLKKSDNEIVKIMMDGCNMGIQSIGEEMNKFPDASKEAKKLADKLIRLEEEFMLELKLYL